MKPDAKLEAKIVRTLAKFLADEGTGLGRWRMAGNAWTYSGAVLWGVAVFGYLVAQWPAVRQFIDAERVRQRSLELDAQVPK